MSGRGIAFVLILAAGLCRAQGSGPDVAHYLTMINNGRVEEVRREIPSLLTQFPNNAGVLFLQGLVSTDGAEAVRIYQSIVDNFPRTEWADDALYRVYQYYYALGLYRTAELKLEHLKKEYPESKYVRGGTESAMKPLPEDRRADTASSQTGNEPAQQFTLQVGAYTTQVNAEKQKLFFEDLGYAVEVVSKLKDNRSLFLVLVATFPSAAEAKSKADEFKQKYNIGSLVVTK
jgi:tetratricopeptide (TPR) repeat protein